MHSDVLVLTRPGQDVEALLAPYWKGDGDEGAYSEWMDRTDEWRGEYESGVVTSPSSPGVEVALKATYGTFDEFVREWHLGDGPDEHGRYGYWHNPNGRWDWYRVGASSPNAYHPERLDRFPAREWTGETPHVVVTPDGAWHENPHRWERNTRRPAWREAVRALMAAHLDTTAHVISAHT